MTGILRRLTAHAPAGQWPAGEALDSVTLDFDARHRRRIRLAGDRGGVFLLDLPRAVALAEGDGLRSEDGGWVAVRAAAEPVLEVRCADPAALARVAWHLGNRHLPTEIAGQFLRIRPDRVIAAMLRGLGAQVLETTAAFQPEGGAYGGQPHAGQGGGGHHHDH